MTVQLGAELNFYSQDNTGLNDDCGICRESLSQDALVAHDCPNTDEKVSHVFHAHCIGQWINQQHENKTKATCPLCCTSMNRVSRKLIREHALIKERKDLRKVVMNGLFVGSLVGFMLANRLDPECSESGTQPSMVYTLPSVIAGIAFSFFASPAFKDFFLSSDPEGKKLKMIIGLK